MTTRKSRFFVMLVHLLGVSLPHHSQHGQQQPHAGVSATWPAWPMALERIYLHDSDNDIRFSQSSRQRRRLDDTVLDEHHHQYHHHPRRSNRRRRQRLARRRRRIRETFEDPPLWLQDSVSGACLEPFRNAAMPPCGPLNDTWYDETADSNDIYYRHLGAGVVVATRLSKLLLLLLLLLHWSLSFES
jgi:hypothetical protein